jgi:hypothetical protein
VRLVPTEDRPNPRDFHVEHRGTPLTREPAIPHDGPAVLDLVRHLKADALAESHRLRAEARAQAPELAPQLIWGWSVDARCPGCDSHLQHVTNGVGGLDTRAIAGCPGCGRRWSITATITDASIDLGRHPRHKAHPDDCTCVVHRNRAAT